jgi:uncharacterized protein
MSENIAITWRRISERYRLEGSICNTCKTKYFPMRKLCPTCRRKGQIDIYNFCGKGKIYSFSEITSAPAGLELHTPYVLAIVRLDEGPMITSQIVEATENDVAIGNKVEMVFRCIRRDDPEGPLHYGYKFKKVED